MKIFKNFISNFKEAKKVQKGVVILSFILLITIFVCGILNAIEEVTKWYGVFILISIFSVPATIWSLKCCLRDIECAPELLKIKATEMDEEKKIDTYFNLLEEKNFSILGPFVALGMCIASFFIYNASVRGIMDWNPKLNTITFVLCECFNITYLLSIFIKSFIKYKKNHAKLLFSFILTAFLGGTIVASFFDHPTLLILITTLIITFNFNNIYPLFYKKINNVNEIPAVEENQESA